jgi:predicted RNA-binding Zn ribbon-like protein
MSIVHVAGHPVLDFVGTVAERGTADEEQLSSAAVLAAWLVGAGLVDEEPMVTGEHLEEARTLREAVYRAVRARSTGRDVDPGDVRVVNGWVGRPAVAPRLGPRGPLARVGTVEDCLATLARSAVELLDPEVMKTVKWCADSRCTHPFIDTSRGQRRRWCDMATCGARNKQRAHRAKTA